MGLGRFFKKKSHDDGPKLPTDYATLLEMSFNHTSALQSAHEGGWRMSEATNYDVDLQAGTIKWFFAENKMATAPAELLGTWNPQDETFLWAWDHPSAVPGTAIASAAVRDYAIQHDIAELAISKVRCEFDECYRITSTAALIGKLQGVYRFDAGGPWVYIGFGNITLSQRPNT